MANQTEIYVSTDIEADGPIPGAHSMLSLASAAYRADKTVISTFSINLETLPEAVPDARTMAWWQGFPEAWAACRRDTRPPEAAMREYAEWLKTLPGRLVFLGFPASWDFMWVYWYLVRFTGERPFREFLNRYLSHQPGPIVDDRGRRIGQHVGLSFYTLGQRQGLQAIETREMKVR